MKVHPEDFNLIKDNLEIETVIGEYLDLRPTGITKTALCPFHTEKTPSFKVWPSTQTFKCMGCGEQGDVINFVTKKENFKTPSEAAKFLADKFDIPIRMMEKKEAQNYEEQEVILANEFALKFFKEKFFSTYEPRKYMVDRGYTKTLVSKWEIGYAPMDYTLDYSRETLEKADLISAKGYPKFRDRIIFPIRDITGRLVGFGGRRLSKNSKYPKYVNTAETPAYKKREVLYGLSQNLKLIKKERDNDDKKYAMIVEGYTDVNLLERADIRFAIASCGTSFTDEQAKAISRHVDYCFLFMDTDRAGEEAKSKIIKKLWQFDADVKPIKAEHGQDPASLAIKHGPDLYSFVEIQCPMQLVYDGAEGNREKKTEECLKAIASTPNHLRRDDLLRLLEKCSKYSFKNLLGRLNKYTNRLVFK